MNQLRNFVLIAALSFLLTSFNEHPSSYEICVQYEVDAKNQSLSFFWKDDQGHLIKHFGALQDWLKTKKQQLVFAMNGGMYTSNNSPLGLYIQEGKIMHPINRAHAKGNFYWQPNGVFYITKERLPFICATNSFVNKGDVAFATQSGPMLVMNGKIHPDFKKGSSNTNIRNGVGILPNGHILFAMSKSEISMYDFAEYFKSKGCLNALYLDGFVSRVYLPEKNWKQLDGDFGVMMGVTRAL